MKNNKEISNVVVGSRLPEKLANRLKRQVSTFHMRNKRITQSVLIRIAIEHYLNELDKNFIE